ncbi:MAG: hypothetical protein HGA19_04970 [Oscillochloris sp.]|nr:hypothetical protein [Oscillochloris sp.]
MEAPNCHLVPNHTYASCFAEATDNLQERADWSLERNKPYTMLSLAGDVGVLPIINVGSGGQVGKVIGVEQHLPARQAPRLIGDKAKQFVGRLDLIDHIAIYIEQRQANGQIAVVSISGIAGIGKTELARKIAPLFPALGSVTVELSGSTGHPRDAEDGLRQVLMSFSEPVHPDRSGEDLAIRYRSLLSECPALILADDVLDEAQVWPLLEPPPGSVLLITSRRPLKLPALAVPIGELTPAESTEFLRVHCPRIGDEAAELSEICGYHPQALELVGSALESSLYNPREYIDRLRAGHHNQVAPLAVVDAVITEIYSSFSQHERAVLDQLAVFPGWFEREAAQAVVVDDEIVELLERLSAHHLVDRQANTYRIKLPSRVRVVICQMAGVNKDAAYRHADYYISLIEQCSEATRLLWDERVNIVCGWGRAAHGQVRNSTALARRYLTAASGVLDALLSFEERILLLTPAIEQAERDADMPLQLRLWLLIILGDATLQSKSSEDGARSALTLYRRVTQVQTRIRTCEQKAYLARATLGEGMAQARLGQHEEAYWCYLEGLTLARQAGSRYDVCLSLANIGNALLRQGKVREALGRYQEGLLLSRSLSDQRLRVRLLRGAGSAMAILGWNAQRAGLLVSGQTYGTRAEQCLLASHKIAALIGDFQGSTSADETQKINARLLSARGVANNHSGQAAPHDDVIDLELAIRSRGATYAVETRLTLPGSQG